MNANEFFDWFLTWRQAITRGIIDCSNQELPIPIEAQAKLEQARAIVEKAALNKELNSDAAMPSEQPKEQAGTSYNWCNFGAVPGLTLRDYFAAAAMLAFVSRIDMQRGDEGYSREAYGLADAMLQERNK